MTRGRLVVLLLVVSNLLGCSEPGDQSTRPKEPEPIVGGPGDGIAADVIALNDRGVAQMGRYEYDAAAATFGEAIDRHPDWHEARVNLAIATLNRQEEGDEQRALALAQAVLEEDPVQLRALYLAAIIQLYLGEPEIAASRLQQVAAEDPEDAYAAYFLGQALMQNADYEGAARWFLTALELDPYLRSAYWAGSQALRRQGRVQEATGLLQDYQRFAPNPAARLAGFSYFRMGPKAEALAVDTTTALPAAKGAGGIFGETFEVAARSFVDAVVTAGDMNGDGNTDLLISGSTQAGAYAGDGGGGFRVVADHPLALTGAAALWGDVDDDGEVDAVLCRATGARVWYQRSGVWTESEVGTDGPCTAGAIFDADHDGDLDVFVTGLAGNELLSNNRDGTFRRLAEDMGLAAGNGRQVLVADLDTDRDLDILVLSAEPPHQIWQNDRTWEYRPFPGLDDLRETELAAITAADTDADGHMEIYGAGKEGTLHVWRNDGVAWTRAELAAESDDTRQLAVADFDGDGRAELMQVTASGFTIIDPGSGETMVAKEVAGVAGALPLAIDPGAGPGVVTVGESGVQMTPPGPGRYTFLGIAPTGRSEAEQMRSNASGIGTHIKVRTAGRWTVLAAVDPHSGPGQSLVPLSVGLGGRDRADFVLLEWSDGVSQTEIDLAAGQLHQIAETQRQLASCPVLFVWDGERYRFVSDIMGVGGLGFFAEPGVSAPPRPFEGYVLSTAELAPRNGRYQVKLTEPMEENAYLDTARIHVYDLPSGWSLVLDERAEISGPPVTGRAITYRRALDPSRAIDRDGKDVTGLIKVADHKAPPPGHVDPRFIGLLQSEQVLTLEFGEPLTGAGAVLVADGWIEYPYSQTVFAAWQAGITYDAPTLEARDGEGRWHTVVANFGYPAGMPRKMALPMPELPEGTNALRLTSNMEVYWDRIQVVFEETLPGFEPQILTPVVARVARTGFARRTTGDQRLPHYDYSDRLTYWDTKFQEGFYTALGDALELVRDEDAAVAIIGGGEEVHLEFEALPPPALGTERFFALDFRGWAKDMDLYTENAETVGPLPVPEGLPDPARREALHARYNVRFQGGF